MGNDEAGAASDEIRFHGRYSLCHFLHVSPPTLKQAVEIKECGVFNQAGEALRTGKAGRAVGIEVRERGGDQRRDAILVIELTSYSLTVTYNVL